LQRLPTPCVHRPAPEEPRDPAPLRTWTWDLASLLSVCLALAALALLVILGILYFRCVLRCYRAGKLSTPDRTWNELKTDLGVESGLLSRPAGDLVGPAVTAEHGMVEPAVIVEHGMVVPAVIVEQGTGDQEQGAVEA
jgi:hypothetical protein